MEKIYDTNDQFNFPNLVLNKPVQTTGGNYFIRLLMNNAPLYIQPPTCKTKQGIVKGGKRLYSDLMFTNENEQFIRWMENLETHCQQNIYQRRSEWFDGDLDLHDIENYFTSPLKIYKSGKYYISRTNISSTLGKTSLKIYDENEQEVPYEAIDDKCNVMTILEIQGIKCSAKSFQVEIELKQMMMLKPSNLFERCVFRIKGETEETVEDATTGQNTVIDVVSDDLPIEPEPVVVQENDSPKTSELEEFKLDLEELPVLDTVHIKDRNDVYYTMYRAAREKAKIARNLALSSYLEAKRIKNTYMLNDFKDSDSDEEDAILEEKYELPIQTEDDLRQNEIMPSEN